jgi:5-methylthioadenosine/S-adenosylhomocysteine deaminase
MAGGALILENALVVTLDDARTTGRFSVVVEDGLITDVAAPAAAARRHGGAERIDCRQRILLPGLVNAHLHPDLQLLKGSLENLGLHDWGASRKLNRALGVLNLDAGRPLQRAAIRAALLDALLGGTTTIGTYGVTTGSEALCAEALADLGLRGAVTIRDDRFASPATLPPEHGCGLAAPIRFFRLHAEETVDDAELRAAAAAHDAGARIVMHAAETRVRVDLARQHFGASTVRVLARYGLLSPRVLLSHAIHVDERERTLIAEAGSPVVASPAAEMKLADGFGPFASFLAKGVAVALGTDAAVCNNGSDMFLECRALGLSQKAAFGADTLDPEQILLCATRHGARALGLDGRIGAIEPGFAADVILVDTANARLQPLVWRGRHANVHANLIWAATGQDVTDVMVAGRWRVRNRRWLGGRARDVWRGLQRAARELNRRIDDVNGDEA